MLSGPAPVTAIFSGNNRVTVTVIRVLAEQARRVALVAFDDLELADLLQPERIGVHLSEEFQLHPEQSTDAIVIHHPEAKYFNAR
ncbi:hypothetical protein ADL27_52965 [Streptomyces sp. NRRL F-6602]|nr:hypothetical protein ADL27_52965 [Streptomyces sp. NRRL F-6602]